MSKIACVGDNCIDFYEQTGKAFPGGNPVNVAVYTCRMGGQASYTGAVGTDENGGFMLRALKSRGVDVSHVQQREGSTALTQVSLVDGERIFGDYDEGVMADFALSEEDIDFLCAHDLVISGLWGKVEHALGRIRARGVCVVFDCADRPGDEAARIALPQTDIAFFSDDGSDDAALEARIKAIAALGPKLVIATRGARGSMAYDGARFFCYGIVPCTVVDSMGAGDSYIAGFLHAWLEKQSIEACMEAGAREAAVTLGCFGAW